MAVRPHVARSGPWPARRRAVLAAAGLAASAVVVPRASAQRDDDVEAALRRGGVVIAFRHALAPGTYDPPGFRVDDCGTQRNLDDAGRAQARRIGAWFQARGLRPQRVRSSPWCRCLDTARLAFGGAEVERALGSPRGAPGSTNAEALAALRAALAALSGNDGFEAWVTHAFVLRDLVGENPASGEGLVLSADGAGAVRVVARLPTQ